MSPLWPAPVTPHADPKLAEDVQRVGHRPDIAIEQHQQPGPDRSGETLGQLVGAALDPGADRGNAVVFQQVKPGTRPAPDVAGSHST